MKTVETMLKKEQRRLAEELCRANARLKKAPKGYVKVVNKRRGVQCYFRGQKKEKWIYMKKEQHHLAEALVQRDYDLQFVRTATQQLGVVETFLQKYRKTDVNKIYQKMSPGRRALLAARSESDETQRGYIVSDEVYVEEWLSFTYEGKALSEGESEIVTERGERVRSKSEKIIADKLYALGIPYRYECPLVLQGNFTVYPDFTILQRATREEVYLEHFGRMDDPGYVEKTMNKLATYEKNGIYLGVNLFMTFETGRRALNTRSLDDLLRKLFCEE